MANKKNKLRVARKKFNLPSGIHSKAVKQRKQAEKVAKYERGKYLENTVYKKFKGPSYQIKSLKACVDGKPRVNFVVRRIPLKRLKFIKKVNKETTAIFKTVEPTLDGYRIMNLSLLKDHVASITIHSALCDEAKKTAEKGNSPIVLVSEDRHGIACLLKAKCNGCGKIFQLNSSDKVDTPIGKQFDINVRGVWGSMVTGGGCSSLNESLGEF